LQLALHGGSWKRFRFGIDALKLAVRCNRQTGALRPALSMRS
jgi:hypothetical protein